MANKFLAVVLFFVIVCLSVGMATENTENSKLKDTIKKREATINNLDLELKIEETQREVTKNEMVELERIIKVIQEKQKELEVKISG